MAEAIGLLTLEARTAQADEALPHETADFASRTSLRITAEQVAPQMLARQHREPFIDAYIRWQLTSFKPRLPAMEDQAFVRVLANLPALLDNPRADAKAIEIFERASESSHVSQNDADRLRQMDRELSARRDAVEKLNTPALELRAWFAAQAGETGKRPHQCRIEHCDAIIAAGWPTRAIKTAITRALGDARADTSLQRSDRQVLAGQLGRLEGRKRRIVTEIAFLANGSLKVQFSTVQVTARDVERWTDRLMDVDRASLTAMSELMRVSPAALLCAFSTSPVVSITATAPPQDQQELSSAAAVRALLALLKREGESAMETGTFPRSHPNIASEFPHDVPLDVLSAQITERQHRTPAVDAYIRWQLTSYAPPLPKQTDGQFERMLSQLCPYAANPRADEKLIGQLNRALQRGELSQSEQESTNDRLNQLAEQTSLARSLNEPVRQYRRWLLDQLPQTGLRALQIRLDDCVQLVRAGWPANRQKQAIEQVADESKHDPQFTARQRKRIARQFGKAAELQTRYVGSARIVENRVEVEYALTGIYDFDVRRWIKAIDADDQPRDGAAAL